MREQKMNKEENEEMKKLLMGFLAATMMVAGNVVVFADGEGGMPPAGLRGILNDGGRGC